LLVNLITRKNLNYLWNFGSILGVIFAVQILRGAFLLFYYSNEARLSFFRVNYIIIESKLGWFFRILHFNGASLFFIFLFLHFFKSILNFSYRLKLVWFIGLLILIFLILEAFTGYCLVWAQIRFWASVVITSLLRVVPLFGMKIVYLVWGGFSVSFITLKFFFVVHFILPFVLVVIILLHLIFLHDRGRTSKIFIFSNFEKLIFFHHYWYKDSLNLIVLIIYFIIIIFLPFKLRDPEMFIESDFLNRPLHIIPEWYFLFAYAILRAIPNKVIGVICLLIRLLVWIVFLLLNYKKFFKDFFVKSISYVFIFNGIYVRWLGQCMVETPYVVLSIIFSFLYFYIIFLKLIIVRRELNF